MLTRNHLMILAAPLALAACGSQADDMDMTDTAMTADAPMTENMAMPEDMPMMQSGEAGATAGAEGTIIKVDEEAKTITIDHGPVPEVEWPAMTMGFAADDAQRASVSAGDKVNFTFEKTADGGKILSITKK